jgi:deoxyribose-phosphate aldolase
MKLNNYIDHTILKADASKDDIIQLCKEAVSNSFYAVCVPPYWVREAKSKLQGTNVKIATVVGFPMGYSHTPAKIEECKRAVDEGANEIDLVINIIALKENDMNFLRNELTSATAMLHLRGAKLKVILETSLLTSDEIIRGCQLCKDMGVDYVKTSTGINGTATVEAVKLLRENLPKSIKIKAAGGIDTKEKALEMIKAGADRIGCSKSVKIISE